MDNNIYHILARVLDRSLKVSMVVYKVSSTRTPPQVIVAVVVTCFHDIVLKLSMCVCLSACVVIESFAEYQIVNTARLRKQYNIIVKRFKNTADVTTSV